MRFATLGLLLAVGAPARAASVSGIVRDGDGEPVAGVYVAVYDKALELVDVAGPTGVDGAFSVAGVPAGTARVRMVPGMALNLVEGWLPGDTLDLCASEPVAIADDGASVDGLVATLSPGVAVTGVVRDLAGEPVAGAVVGGAPLVGGNPAQERQALTGSDGSFEVRGLAPELAWTFRIEAEGLPLQRHPGTYDTLGATSVSGAPEELVDIGGADLLPGIRVGGQVRGPDGPLSDVLVSVYSDRLVRVPTDADGRYLADGLQPGGVIAWAGPEGYGRTFTPDLDRPGPRVDVLEDGAEVLDVDLDLPLEARLEGRLLADADLSEASVLVYNDDLTVGYGGAVAADGSFSVGRLHGGEWLLAMNVAGQGYVSEFAGGTDPVRFEVPDEGVGRAEVELRPAVTFEGTVTDEDGEPFYDALVTVISRRTEGAWATRTSLDGAWSVIGLPPDDTYDITVEGDAPCPDVDDDHVRMHHPGTPDPLRKVGIAVRGGDVVRWDITLPLDADRDGMADRWEVEHGLDPSRVDSGSDPDGDGWSNLIEYWEDSDPLVSNAGGCSALPVGSVAWWVLLLPMWLRRRR